MVALDCGSLGRNIKLKEMQITVTTDEITSFSTPALVVNLFKGVTQSGGATGAVDKALGQFRDPRVATALSRFSKDSER